MQERHKSIANALDLRLSCTNPSIYPLNTMWSHQSSSWQSLCDILSAFPLLNKTSAYHRYPPNTINYMIPLQSWWRHQMETFSALLALCAGNSPVTGEFPSQRPVTRSFGVSFHLHLNKWLSKQSWGWWSETPSRPLWRHYNGTWLMRPSCIISLQGFARKSNRLAWLPRRDLPTYCPRSSTTGSQRSIWPPGIYMQTIVQILCIHNIIRHPSSYGSAEGPREVFKSSLCIS